VSVQQSTLLHFAAWPLSAFVAYTCRCHFTLGNSVADAYKSLELARTAWEIATGGEALAADAAAATAPLSRGVLKPGGSLVMKLLQGSGAQQAGSACARGDLSDSNRLFMPCCAVDQAVCLPAPPSCHVQARKSLRQSCGKTLQRWHGTAARQLAARAKRYSCLVSSENDTVDAKPPCAVCCPCPFPSSLCYLSHVSRDFAPRCHIARLLCS
jgi:hypothetical protein